MQLQKLPSELLDASASIITSVATLLGVAGEEVRRHAAERPAPAHNLLYVLLCRMARDVLELQREEITRPPTDLTQSIYLGAGLLFASDAHADTWREASTDLRNVVTGGTTTTSPSRHFDEQPDRASPSGSASRRPPLAKSPPIRELQIVMAAAFAALADRDDDLLREWFEDSLNYLIGSGRLPPGLAETRTTRVTATLHYLARAKGIFELRDPADGSITDRDAFSLRVRNLVFAVIRDKPRRAAGADGWVTLQDFESQLLALLRRENATAEGIVVKALSTFGSDPDDPSDLRKRENAARGRVRALHELDDPAPIYEPVGGSELDSFLLMSEPLLEALASKLE